MSISELHLWCHPLVSAQAACERVQVLLDLAEPKICYLYTQVRIYKQVACITNACVS
jgi:hypothetical protein